MTQKIIISVWYVLALVCCNSSAVASPTSVYWSGFAYTGKFGDVKHNFPLTSEINANGQLDEIFNKFILENSKEFKKLNLIMGKIANESDSPVTMAIAITREDFTTENLSSCQKLTLNLIFRIVFIDMSTKTVLNSYPICFELLDAPSCTIDNSYKKQLLYDAIFGSNRFNMSILSLLKQKLPTLSAGYGNTRTVQVRNVRIGPKASTVLHLEGEDRTSAFTDIVSQRFTDELTKGLAISMLPSGRDSLNGKCSLTFADGKEQNFTIPEPSFAIDISINDLQTKELKSNNIERAIAYGVFSDVRIYEPEYNIEFFKKEIIYGVPKKVSVTTSGINDTEVFKEAIQLAYKKITSEIAADAKTEEEVIKKCLLQ